MKLMFTGTGQCGPLFLGKLQVAIAKKYPGTPIAVTLAAGSEIDLPDELAQWYLDNAPTDFVKVGATGKPDYRPLNAPPKEPEPIEKPAHRGFRRKMIDDYPNK